MIGFGGGGGGDDMNIESSLVALLTCPQYSGKWANAKARDLGLIHMLVKVRLYQTSLGIVVPQN